MILGHVLCSLVAACEEIFKIASMAPGALLLEAHKEYEVEALLNIAYVLLLLMRLV